jgi:3-hydroxybutyryl-CoA dehydrogenase
MTRSRQVAHTPVLASDLRGFIANHAGRGCSTEALGVASQGVADFATIAAIAAIAAILKDQADFKLEAL